MTLKPNFDHLSAIAAIVGLTTAAIGGFTLALPIPANKIWEKLPRSIWPGRILAAICITWAALWLCIMPLGPLMFIREHLWVLLPVAIAAVWIFTPELLTCRAIGGLLVLLPAPMLSAATWHPSPARYIIIVYAYAMIITGMFYIAQPWLLRDHITWSQARRGRARTMASIAIALGLILTICSATVFRVTPQTRTQYTSSPHLISYT